VKELRPVLGPLHPVVAENIALLKGVSRMDEVSFHMSGTRGSANGVGPDFVSDAGVTRGPMREVSAITQAARNASTSRH
jgi:hypothetical protein